MLVIVEIVDMKVMMTMMMSKVYGLIEEIEKEIQQYL